MYLSLEIGVVLIREGDIPVGIMFCFYGRNSSIICLFFVLDLFLGQILVSSTQNV